MKRVRMTRSTLGLTLNDAPSEAHHTIRGALPADGHALGEVLFLAYLGGPDQEENDEGEGRAEIARTMGGAYGPFVEAASFVAEDAEGLVGASLVTRFEGVPLLAHLVVHPRAQRRGLGSRLAARTIAALGAMSEPTVRLAVHRESPARALYTRLGFVEV
jgi:GNAT superfamily N-acetyltransferase